LGNIHWKPEEYHLEHVRTGWKYDGNTRIKKSPSSPLPLPKEKNEPSCLYLSVVSLAACVFYFLHNTPSAKPTITIEV
jgi:hypothetical protein